MENDAHQERHEILEAVRGVARRKWQDIFVQLVLSFVGFGAALAVNGAISHYEDHEAFLAMMKSVNAEVDANTEILAELDTAVQGKSQDLVLDFELTTVTQTLANPSFVMHASATVLGNLRWYVRALSTANNFRVLIGNLERSTGEPSKLLVGIRTDFEHRLTDCADAIKNTHAVLKT